jgi:hypothetical protein
MPTTELSPLYGPVTRATDITISPHPALPMSRDGDMSPDVTTLNKGYAKWQYRAGCLQGPYEVHTIAPRVQAPLGALRMVSSDTPLLPPAPQRGAVATGILPPALWHTPGRRTSWGEHDRGRPTPHQRPSNLGGTYQSSCDRRAPADGRRPQARLVSLYPRRPTRTFG